MTSYVSGKALLVIDKNDSKWVPWDVTVFMQSCSDPEGYGYLNEYWWLLASDALPLPDAAYKMNVGDRLRVAVTYEFFFSPGTWGYDEDVIELSYTKQRVLRRQPYRGQ